MQRTKMALQNSRMLSVLRLGVMFYCLYFYDPYENVVGGNFSLSNACVVEERDINIGVMLPMTIPHLEPGCTRLSLESARFAEFIAYSVERVNKERPLAFNLAMGYIILDNCFRGYVTSGHAVSFLHQPACSGDHSDMDLMENYDVVAVMSADSNVFSKSSCSILDSGQVPYISILSNNDRLLYPYFTTIMPSNRFLFEVIITILEKYSWTYVVIFVTRNHFEIQDMYTFTDLLEDNGICYHMQWIDNPISRANLAAVVNKFRKARRSGRVVVLLTQDEYIVRDVIFELSLYTSAGKMIWIITIPVSHIDKESLEHLMGSLIVDVKDFNVPEFDDWLVQLDNKLHDPWYRSYWEKKFNCSFDRATCNTSQILDKNDFRQDMVFNYGGYVIDSVFMIASAVSRVLLSTDCNNVDGSLDRGCVTGPRLLKELKATSQKGYTGWVTLHNDRESCDRHITIRQVREESTVTIASINARTGQWHDVENATWIYHGFSSGAGYPKSDCNSPCGHREAKTIHKTIKCCFVCTACDVNEIVKDSGKRCSACPLYTWPSENNTCENIPPKSLGMDTLMGLVQALLSAFCLSACIGMFVFFRYNRTNRIIKASSMELSLFMLFAISLGYISVLSFMVTPNELSCKLSFISWGISFSLIYGPLFVRTLWVYRVFEASKKSTRRPRMTGVKTQVFFCLIIVLVQLALLVIPMTYGIRWHKLTMLSRDKPEVILMCSWPAISVTAFLISTFPLMGGSALLAFKTRHLPNNFNESHFICICVCTTIIVFVSFIPTFVSTTYELTKTKILAIILLINHSVALTFLFLPKVYAVQKWKDVQLTTPLTNKDDTSCKPVSSATCSTVMSNRKGHKPVCSDPPSAISSPTDQRQKTEETGESGKFDPQTITQKALSDTGLVQSDNNPEAVLETSVHLDNEDARGQTGYKTEETVQSDNGPERINGTSLPSADKHATLNKPTSQSGTVQKPESSDVKISHHDQDSGRPSNESSFNGDVQVAEKHLASETAGILDSVTKMLRNPSPGHK